MSTTKPALLRAFAESFASPSHTATQKPLHKKRKVCKSTQKLQRKVNHANRKATQKTKALLASSFLYIVQPICTENPLCLFLNTKFCEDNGLEDNTLVDLTIHGVIDKHWVVEFVYHDHSINKRKAIMQAGFQEFIEDNGLKEGDELVFHLMPCALGKTTRPWLQVFVKSQIKCKSNNHALDQVGDQVFFSNDCSFMNPETLSSTTRIIIQSPEEPINQDTRPPVERSYKLVFNGKVVRHFFTLEYNN